MVCWNKVSPASTYLDNVRSSADKGPVRVCVVGSVGSLQILAVCVSIKESRWLAIGVATSTPSSVLLCGMVQFLQIHGPVVMDCKPVLRGVMLQPMFLQRFLDLISSGEWLFRSLKSGMVRESAGVPVLYCWFSAIFNLWRAAYNWRKKASMIFNVISTFTGHSVSSYLSIVLVFSFIIIRSSIPFGCLFFKIF